MSDKKEVLKLLQRAKQVLVKNKWTKGSLAKKANGRTGCSVYSSQAKCFCAVGALHKVNKCIDYTFIEAQRALDLVCTSNANSVTSVVRFNDYIANSKKDVLNVFDKAIKNVKESL